VPRASRATDDRRERGSARARRRGARAQTSAAIFDELRDARAGSRVALVASHKENSMKTNTIATLIFGLATAGLGACGGGGDGAAGPDGGVGVPCGDTTCGPNEECQLAGGQPECVCPTGPSSDGTCTPQFAPESCAEVVAHASDVTDGTFTLYYNHDPRQPWAAYCDGMHDQSGAPPREYLPLRTRISGNPINYSEMTNERGETVRTIYRMVRIDPVELTIDIGDQHFVDDDANTGVTSGFIGGGAVPVYRMPFGEAMVCGDVGEASAIINLIDTPFTMASQLCTNTADLPAQSNGMQSTQFTMLGQSPICQFEMVKPCPSGSVNDQTGGARLKLQYGPIAIPLPSS
jgi:hypothetical protein